MLPNAWTEKYGMQKKIEKAFIPPLCSLALCLAFTVHFLEISDCSLSFAIPLCNPSLCLTTLLHAYFWDNMQCKWMPHSVLSALSFAFSDTRVRRKERRGWGMKWPWTACLLCPTFRGCKQFRVRSTYELRQLGGQIVKVWSDRWTNRKC